MRSATAANTLQVYVSQVRKIVSDRLKTEGAPIVSASRMSWTPIGSSASPRRDGARAWSYGEARSCSPRRLPNGAARRSPTRYDSFAQGEIARLEELRLAAVEDRIEADLGLGRHDQLVGELEALVAEHPTRERLRSLQMIALYRAGQADALEAYRDARGAPRRARARARAGAEGARAGDPPPGRSARAGLAPEQRAGAGQHARRAAA